MPQHTPIIYAADLVNGNYTRDDFQREIHRRLSNMPGVDTDGDAAFQAKVIADIIDDYLATDKLDADTDADEIDAWGSLASDLRLIEDAVDSALDHIHNANEIAGESISALESIQEAHYTPKESD